jgi:hypothetical protein
VSAGVVRGISDLLSGKTDADLSGTQELAADAASAAAFEILHGLVPPPKSSPKSKKRRVKLPKWKADRSKKAREMPLVETPPTEELPTFPEVPNNIQQGGLLQEGRGSARIGVPDLDEVLFSFFTPPDVYLRIIPATPARRSTKKRRRGGYRSSVSCTYAQEAWAAIFALAAMSRTFAPLPCRAIICESTVGSVSS